MEGVEPLDINAVKSYAHDLRTLLEKADIAQSKSFIKSFVKRIDMDGKVVRVSYKLPTRDGLSVQNGVLPIETFGGAEVSIGRTDSLLFQIMFKLFY
jgi:site-specific DNA recombinase